MKRSVAASACKEDRWSVAQALKADVAGQGESADEALMNLSGALPLHSEPPVPAVTPELGNIEVDIATP